MLYSIDRTNVKDRQTDRTSIALYERMNSIGPSIEPMRKSSMKSNAFVHWRKDHLSLIESSITRFVVQIFEVDD